MLSEPNDVAWMDQRAGEVEEEEEEEEGDAVSWTTRRIHDPHPSNFPSFKPILGNDWFTTTDNAIMTPTPLPPLQPPSHHHSGIMQTQNPLDFRNIFAENLMLQATMEASSSCSQSPAFTLDPSQPPQPPFLAHKSSLSSLLNVVCATPFGNTGLNHVYDPQFLGQSQGSDDNNSFLMNFGAVNSGLEMGAQLPSSNSDFPALGSVFGCLGVEGFDGSLSSQFGDRSKVPIRASESVEGMGGEVGCHLGKRRLSEEDEVGEGCFDVSGFDYDSDENNDIDKFGECGKNENFSTSSGLMEGGDQKGKKKRVPAKNLMAERRRRKKLNDRLYMLRSVVPRISKMDRASILGDAIEYLKELLQRIKDLHNESESSHPGSSTLTQSFNPLTPGPPTLPCRVKEELCPNSMSSSKSQAAKVEVHAREGGAVNIHMFCARRPGLLLSTVRALDNLGLDVQQAVISCFNGFALDVFRAEQCREDLDILPEQIKAVLLDSAGFHGVM